MMDSESFVRSETSAQEAVQPIVSLPQHAHGMACPTPTAASSAPLPSSCSHSPSSVGFEPRTSFVGSGAGAGGSDGDGCSEYDAEKRRLKEDGCEEVADLHLEEFEELEKMKAKPADADTAAEAESSGWLKRWGWWGWVGVGMLAVLVLAGLAAAAAFLGPLIFKEVILPVMEWEENSLSKPVLAAVAVTSMAVFPVFMLPTGPSMWVLGIVFDYVWGFCLIMLGAFFGQSLPYFVGHWLMHDRVQAWLATIPRSTAILKLVESGGWCHQFRTTLVLRMSPFPYPLFNYAITATKIRYSPYICASMVAMIPETFIAIYCGKLIKKLVDAHQQQQRHVTPVEVAYEVLGLCVATSVVLFGLVKGSQALRELEMQEAALREGVEMEEEPGHSMVGFGKELTEMEEGGLSDEGEKNSKKSSTPRGASAEVSPCSRLESDGEESSTCEEKLLSGEERSDSSQQAGHLENVSDAKCNHTTSSPRAANEDGQEDSALVAQLVHVQEPS